VSEEALAAALQGLGLPGWRLEQCRQARHAITGVHLEVVIEQAHAEHAHRGLGEIRRLIDGCETMSGWARETAQRIFTLIGVAEAKIHGVELEDVHFHEVGAVDSIVDVCGAAVVLDLLGRPEVLCTPPPLGSGSIRSAHGQMPVPAPATLEILRDVPVRFEGVGELTTPTGAAILKAVATIGAPPPLVVQRVGYGVGTRDFADRPNVLRACLADRVAAGGPQPRIWTIEATVDDCSPQLLGALVERMLALGAHEAFIAPVVMKKSRPGHLFTAIAPAERKAEVIDALLRESTTLGVRCTEGERVVLDRRFETVATRWGEVRVKLGLQEGRVVNAQPEFEDCRLISSEHDVPIKQVQAAALAAWSLREGSGA
jgi:pyridinium-3,5-bisthiocarboxylic acid mononucleotide nickel chelatase